MIARGSTPLARPRPRAILGLAVLPCLWGVTVSHAAPIPPIRNLAMIEFVDSPPTGLKVSGGLLGVPDSAGVFPMPYKRFDPVSGNFADPGRVAGDALVFTNLRPGSYRLALVFLTESRIASKLLPKHGEKFEDRCMVYSDTIPELTFTIADQEVRYLGRVIRRVLPSLAGEPEGLWKSWIDWTPGDERRVVKSLVKRKDMAQWQELIGARLAILDSTSAKVR